MLKLWENPMLSIEERLEVASGEIERLHGLMDAARNAVEKANEQAERFEREWYLRGDALDEALDALKYLMQQFDCETWQCPHCGHAEDTATMDSAAWLRDWMKTHN